MTRENRIFDLVGLVLAAIVFAAVAFGPAVAFAQDTEPAEQNELLTYERNIIDVVESVGNSVATVIVTVQGNQVTPGGAPQQYRQGTGSGFVVNDLGQVITNLHVIEAALEQGSAELLDTAEISLSFPSLDTDLPADVVGINPDHDLALIQLLDPAALPAEADPIPFASEVKVGEIAIAIGNPFGLQSTVTTGIVSAIERERPGAYGMDIPFVQTDAAINPGNSGGPLLNSRGELIGVNNAILTPTGGFAGVGFAVPAFLVEENLAALQEGGVSGLVGALADPDRPVVGIQAALSVEGYPEELRRQLTLPEQGVVVTGVQAGGPAAEAGLRGPQFTVSFRGQQFPAGADIITAINGQEISDVRDLQRYLIENAEPGETVTLEVFRDGEITEIDVTLTTQAELGEN